MTTGNICIVLPCTSSYSYAIEECITAISVALKGRSADLYLCTDKSSSVMEKIRTLTRLGNLNVKEVAIDVCDSGAIPYKEKAQIIIAQLLGNGFEMAREGNYDLCWIVESDVIVHPDSLDSLIWALNYPSSPRYEVTCSTYFNGSFLCGRGTPYNQIAEDYLPSEKVGGLELSKKIKAMSKKLNAYALKRKNPPKEMIKEMDDLHKKLKESPPKANVFALNAKKWRKRGWLDQAYAGSAVQGAVLPTDWCGHGCTLLSKKALMLSNFVGYAGHGTQDLFLCWNKWYPAGIKIGLVVGVPAYHVKKDPKGNLFAWEPYFVPDCEETAGHLRVRQIPFIKYNSIPQANEPVPKDAS
jgi:hypothetical protein